MSIYIFAEERTHKNTHKKIRKDREALPALIERRRHCQRNKQTHGLVIRLLEAKVEEPEVHIKLDFGRHT